MNVCNSSTAEAFMLMLVIKNLKEWEKNMRNHKKNILERMWDVNTFMIHNSCSFLLEWWVGKFKIHKHEY